MEDSRIVELYLERNELAIRETAYKYGGYCFRIAINILTNREDAEESVNDTYMKTWESIPPHKPNVFSSFIGRIARNVSLNKWRNRNRIKRGGGQVFLALEELEECIPSEASVEERLIGQELSKAINSFLDTLTEVERDIFVCRYWAFASVHEISKKFDFTEGKVKSILFRTREKLKRHLGKEGFI